MKIFIDLGHPAHVHYFKNFIKIMEEKGHTFSVSARDRSIIHYLLNKYNISFYNRGKGKNSIPGKLFYMIIADIKLWCKSRQFRPDVFISFGSPYAAQVAWVLRKPHIVLDDTEHARFSHALYKPFSTVFLNPDSFEKDFGKKQILFKSFTELFYLHPKYLKDYSDVYDLLRIGKEEKFILFRFISWNANHDIGHSGLNISTKKELINLLTKMNYKVFISSEGENKDPFFEKFIIKIPPELIHQILFNSTLVISEGATMASECAMLGTPVIYVNSLDAGTLREQEDKYSLLNGFRTSGGVIMKVKELLNTPNLKETYQLRRQTMLSEKIDLTSFLIWFVENLPDSILIMKKNPDYQLRFK